jgi:hypothetical protein
VIKGDVLAEDEMFDFQGVSQGGWPQLEGQEGLIQGPSIVFLGILISNTSRL